MDNTGEQIPEHRNFYENIRNNHGNLIQRTCKYYAKINRRMTANICARKFLLNCRKYGLIPDFIRNKFNPELISKNFNINLNNDRVNNSKELNNMQRSIESLCNNFNNKLLNILIRDKCVRITSDKKLLKLHKQKIIATIPPVFANYFINSQFESCRALRERLKCRQKRKFDELKRKVFTDLNIDLDIENEAFANYTDIVFPKEVIWLLSLGKKFSLPYNSNEFPLFNLIADSELCIGGVEDVALQASIRSDICAFLRHSYKNYKTSKFGKFINQIYKDSKNFLKLHGNLIVTQADKGGKTVIIERTDYMAKMQELLDDRSTYRPLRKDPTSTNQNSNNELVRSLFSQNLIDERKKRSLTTYVALPPKLYGLPKIHKVGVPLRPIVSQIRSPAYFLSKFLGGFLKKWTLQSKFNIKNSFDFKDRVKDIQVNYNEYLVSFDVVSLFTSVPVDLCLKIIQEKWDSFEGFTNIPKGIFMKLLKFCVVDNNYFLFNNCIYRQVSGTPMGGPLSPILVDIVMEDLLDVSITKFNESPKILVKYVDDLFAVMPKDKINSFLNILNNYHKNIKFTCEIEESGSLPYLDLKLSVVHGRIMTDWYQKPTSSGRLLNFLSSHPKHLLLNTAYNFVRRVLSLGDITSRVSNEKRVYDILERNNYPRNIIKKLIDRCTQQDEQMVTQPNSPVRNLSNDDQHYYVGTTFVPGVSPYVARILGRCGSKARMAYSNKKTVGGLFSRIKDVTSKEFKTDVVYEIQCGGSSSSNCDKKYIGTTKQFLKNRIQNHKNDIKAMRGEKTALAQHCVDCEHRPIFDDTKILCVEKDRRKRMLLESLHIQSSANTMNKKQDTDNLHDSYRGLVAGFINYNHKNKN